MKQKNFRPKRDNAPRGDRKPAHKSAPRERDHERDDEKKSFKPRHTTVPREARLSGPVLYGFHAVRAAVMNPNRRILRILGTDSALDEFKATMGAVAEAGLKRPNLETFDKVAFDRMMPQGAVHQGIAALVESLPVRDASDLLEDMDIHERSVLLILDQVTDPHNIGAIMRSAAAFGADGIIMQDRHAPEMAGVLAKVASGAADVIPVALETNLSRCIEMLQENGFFVIGLDERGEDIGKLPYYKKLALVLGAEGEGLRRLVAEHCDTLASLPTRGQILSLNVSNAAAVALYATLKASA